MSIFSSHNKIFIVSFLPIYVVNTLIVQSIKGMFNFVFLYTVLDIMKDPVWSASINNKKIILSSKSIAQNRNHQTNALLTSIKVETIVEGWPQERPMVDGSETDLSPVHEEKYEITPSPSKPNHQFETKPSVKAEAVPYKERSQCLTLHETDAAVGEESGWYESHDEQSREIESDDDDDTDHFPVAIGRQNL